MHQLHLLRHAKSSWDEGVEDRDRKLSRRGREAAALVGRRLPTLTGGLDLVLCSTARRTRDTLDLAIAGFAERPRILIEEGLYLTSAAQLMQRLRALPESAGRVLLVGHNPSLHELALALSAPGSPSYRSLAEGKFPTAALASIGIASPWSAIDRVRHPLMGYETPQSLAESEG